MTNFKVNDAVIHSREGLSKIFAIEQMNGEDYFLLKARRGGGETIYVPVSKADNIIRQVMNETQADELLIYMRGVTKQFNTNTKQRRDDYKKRLCSGKVKEIAYLACQLHFYYLIGGHNNEEIKLGPVDFEMLNYAHNMLLDELSLSYQQPRDEIENYIVRRINTL